MMPCFQYQSFILNIMVFSIHRNSTILFNSANMTESLLVPNIVVVARDGDLNTAMAAPGGVHSQRTHTDNGTQL